MKEKIFNNFSLKILSAICAIVLWAIIVNIYDPSTGITVSGVSVQLVNTESLTDKGYTYDVVDGGKISVYVCGPKSVITDIKASDIIATADLSNVTAYTDYVDIDVKVVVDGKSLTNVQVTPRTTSVKLDIENRVTQEFNVGMEVTGNAADGYVMVDRSISPTTIKVTGPANSISKISQVKAVFDATGASSDIQGEAKIVLYDSEGNVITDSNLELSDSKVDFMAKIGLSKKVPIKYSTTGTVADGYAISQITPSASDAVITGSSGSLDKVSQIEIPADALDVNGLKETKVYRVWLSDYIPANVTLVSDKHMTITVEVESVDKKDISIKSSDIKVENISDDLTASIMSPDSLTVSVYGLKKTTESLKESDITAGIDVNGMTEGEYDVPVTLTLPDGCSVKEKYTVHVNIQKKN